MAFNQISIIQSYYGKPVLQNIYFLLNSSQKTCSSCPETCSYHEEVKYVPIYKRNDKKDKCNHRPKSILSNISKVYERNMQEQLDEYISVVYARCMGPELFSDYDIKTEKN